MDELVSLNADSLDIEDLERRIELSQMLPLGMEGPSDCIVECGSLCPKLNSCGTFG